MKYKHCIHPERENTVVVEDAARVTEYLIERKRPSNTRCFIEMYPNGTFGWHWDFYDGGRAFPGPRGVFEGVTAPEDIQAEIKNRNWPDAMSPALRTFADGLWEKFFEVNSNIPKE